MNVDYWLKVQLRLAKLGFNPGEIDGYRGRKTVSALKRFQDSKGLVTDGILGPKTWTALFGDPAPGVLPRFDDLPRFDEAVRLIGLKEISGKKSAKEILEMADTLDIDYDDDDIPWCGLFVGHCIASALGDEPIPPNPLGARNWNKFGINCKSQVGCVLLFYRGKKTGWQGHVGFYFAEDSHHYHVLGGNQSNSVNVVKIGRERLIASRWPITAGLPTGLTLAGDDSTSASTLEA